MDDAAAAERNEATIRSLYDALDRHDGEAMAACYAADATFSDPVFPDLHGGQAGDMWRMLTARATDLAVELPEAKADAQAGSARWVATYTFGQTGRTVSNRVRSDFKFGADGLIAEQQDDFPFWRWSRQALGMPGLALGWTPLLRSKVQANAAAELARFRADRRGGSESG
jgi:ketosteroid isomerase-like protein